MIPPLLDMLRSNSVNPIHGKNAGLALMFISVQNTYGQVRENSSKLSKLSIAMNLPEPLGGNKGMARVLRTRFT